MNVLYGYQLTLKWLFTAILTLLLSLSIPAQNFQARIKTFQVDTLGNIYIQYYNNTIANYPDKTFQNSEGLELVASDGSEIISFKNDSIFYLRNDFILEKKASGLIKNLIYNDNNLIAVLSNDKIEFLSTDSECDNAFVDVLDIHMIQDKIYHISTNGISELCTDFLYTQVGNFEITCSEKIDFDKLLIGTKNQGIQIFAQDQFKQLFIPGITFPNAITELKYKDPFLYILDGTQNLYTYDWENQSLEFISSDVLQFQVDPWNVIYINDGFKIKKYDNLINDKLPHLKIVKIEGDSTYLNFTKGLKIKGNTLNIFTDIKYPSGLSRLISQYKLGNGDNWQEFNGSVLSLKNIVYGKQTLSIRTGIDEENFTDPILLQINRAQPWYKNIWLFVFMGLGLLILFNLYYLKKNRTDLEKIEKEKDRLKMELELVRFSQRAEQVKLNPHFIFNSINSISGLIALNENQLARKSLNQFAQLLRQSMSFSEGESIPIEQERVFLEKYLQLEQIINDGKFDFSIKIDKEISSIPPMIIQPFVENAIIHGIKPKTDKGEIEIIIRNDSKYIVAEIIDNGIGRQASAAKIKSNHKSEAVTITNERLSKLDRWNNKERYIEYFDRKPTGTKVNLYIAKKRI